MSFDLEAFLGNIATRNPEQFTFRFREGQLLWARELSGLTASGVISLRDDEIMPDFHQRFWDCVFETPWDKANTDDTP